jgi:hypothetical protein
MVMASMIMGGEQQAGVWSAFLFCHFCSHLQSPVLTYSRIYYIYVLFCYYIVHLAYLYHFPALRPCSLPSYFT